MRQRRGTSSQHGRVSQIEASLYAVLALWTIILVSVNVAYRSSLFPTSLDTARLLISGSAADESEYRLSDVNAADTIFEAADDEEASQESDDGNSDQPERTGDHARSIQTIQKMERNLSKPKGPIRYGDWTMGNYSAEYAKLKALYPDAPESFVESRAEFGALHICSPYHNWYSCKNQFSCVEGTTCIHFPNKTIRFGMESFLAGLKWEEQKTSRRRVLENVLDRMDRTVGRNMLRKDGFIMIMTLNAGYSFLFGNWFCSLSRYNIDVDYVRSKILMLPRDDEAARYVQSLGFFSPTLKELESLAAWTSRPRLDKKRIATSFAHGDHSHLNMFMKFGMPLDLLEMNYTVAIQDVDFIWFRNPIPLVQQYCRDHKCHAAFIAEGRPFVIEANSPLRPWRPGRRPIAQFNTGFFMLVPKPRVIHFLRVLMQGVHLQQWRRRDQLYYNTIAYHTYFKDLRVHILPVSEYIPGVRLHRANLEKFPLADVKDLVVMHVSDTGSYLDKVDRFKQLGHWYFTENVCPVAFQACKDSATCWKTVTKCRSCQ